MKYLTSKICAVVFSGILCFGKAEARQDPDVDFYASIRLGIDNVDAGTDNDGINGRDFLSRVGFHGTTDLSDSIEGIAQVEYGLRSDNLIDERQNGGPTLRLASVGVRANWGEVLFGSQTTLWEKYVGASYFSDGNDSVRQHTVRDDDLLQYYFNGDNFSVGAGLQMEGQDGDDIDQVLLGGEYKLGPTRWQVSYSKDNRGINTGQLVGARAWWNLNPHWTLSAYTQQADEDYDIYPGSSTGDVRLIDDDGNTLVPGIPSCATEARQSSGLFGQYHLSHDTLRVRYGVDACDVSGDVQSTKVEYLHAFNKHYSMWASLEDLHNDEGRKANPLNGKDLSEIQLGMRFDI